MMIISFILLSSKVGNFKNINSFQCDKSRFQVGVMYKSCLIRFNSYLTRKLYGKHFSGSRNAVWYLRRI